MRIRRFCLILVLCFAPVGQGLAAEPPDTKALIASQQQAMAALAIFDGTWRGPASATEPSGQQRRITQTERVGSLLDGSIKVIEGRGFTADGVKTFNAFAVISFSPQTSTYNFHAYAQGHSGDFPMQVTPNGFTWSIKAGPATIRYTATVTDGVWSEIGERIVEGQQPAKIFEMTLRRVGNTDWPAAGAVPPQ